MSRSRIPKETLLEAGLPVAQLYELARREGNSKKPIFEIHKWWARRLGSAFRALLIAATSPAIDGESKRQRAQRLFDSFYQNRSLRGIRVLDPFMGGGTSVVEALKKGAQVVGVEIDPVAWFVTKKQVEMFNKKKFLAALAEVAGAVESDIRRLYSTVDPLTRKRGEVVNAFWVTRIRCGSCRHAFDAHPSFQLGYDEAAGRRDVFCRACGTIHNIPFKWKTFTCSDCSETTNVLKGPIANGQYSCPHCSYKEAVRSRTTSGRPAPKRLFALEYTVPGESDARTGRPVRHLKSATAHDQALYKEAQGLLRSSLRSLKFPRGKIFKRGRFDLRPISFGYSRYSDLFNARQLYCLSRIYTAISEITDQAAREYLLLALSDSLAANNQLVGYAFGYRKASPLFGIHGYHVVQRPVEGNVWGNPHFGRASFTRCVEKLVLGKEYAGEPFEYAYSPDGYPIRVYCGESIATPVARSPRSWNQSARALLLCRSSTDLSPLKSESIDLILTDPPFYDNLPYSELSDFYYQWLRPSLGSHAGKERITPISESLFVRRKSETEHEKYVAGLTSVMKECGRVLKRRGLLAFTFHHKEPAAWHALGSAIAASGFRITSVSPLRGEGVSGFHTYDGTPKWDAVITCRLVRTNAAHRPAVHEAIATRIAERSECEWYEELKDAGVVLSYADRASLAFAFAMKEGVNSRDETHFATILGLVAAKYPQKGIAPSIPGRKD